MKINKEIEYNNIIKDILKNEEFIALKYEMHHGMSRLDHSLNVSKLTYNICKVLNMKNISEVTRAALLHDFFTSSQVISPKFIMHPYVALSNAKNNFELNKMQENIISSHMFPFSITLPRYKESWLVSLIDKWISLREVLIIKVPLAIGASFLFLFYPFLIQR